MARHFVAVSTNAEQVRAFGIDTREHVRVLGLGRRPLLALLGDRPAADDRHRAGELPRDAGRLPRHGPRTSATAPLERNMPVILALLGVWYNNFFGAADPRDPALRPVPAPLRRPTSSRATWKATASRSAGAARRVRVADRPGHLGRAGHQRPARLLPAHPPGHQADPVRLHRLLPLAQPAGRPPRQADGQLLRADRGAGLRQDRRRGARRGRDRATWCRTRPSRATGRPTRSWPSS